MMKIIPATRCVH